MKDYDILIKRHPHLFKHIRVIHCGLGWYNLLEALAEKLEPLGVQALQVKEKFAGLCFYLSEGNERAEALIKKAEEKSIKTCDQCGAPGAVFGTYYVSTRCAEHAEDVVKTVRMLRDRMRDVVVENNELCDALELIAAGPRPDGTFNRDRRACMELARKAIRAEEE